MLLGEVDYGLIGLIGGLTAFVSFFNSILTNAVGRFYAFSVGRANIAGNEESGLLECRQWFTVAVSLHAVLAVVLIAIGYPLGEWAVKNYLVIPSERIASCVWVWRFVCITCFTGMVCVPIQGMYYARQYIAELTIYSFVTSTLNIIVLYYMLHHHGDWFVTFALWMNLLAVAPRIIISARAFFLFKECRFVDGYWFHGDSIKKLLSYSFWNFFNTLGLLLRNTGTTVLVNKMLGPAKNAAVTVANTVAGHATTLSGAFVGAIIPAITTARGAEDRERLIKLVHSTCKFGTVLAMLFVIPLILEIKEVMVLWLENPPAGSAELSALVLVSILLDKLTTGHWAGIAANGKIAEYQFLAGVLFACALPSAWFMMRCGYGVVSVGIAFVGINSLVIVLRLYELKKWLDISPRYWIYRIFLPILMTAVIVSIVGLMPRIWMSESFSRVVVTTLICVAVFVPMAWFFVLDLNERIFLKTRILSRLHKNDKG